MKFLPYLLCIAGIAFSVISFGRLGAAYLPYLDATPELLALQQEQIRSAWLAVLPGLAMFGGGIAWLVLRRRARLAKR
jgi:hypothetical protein